MAKKKYTNSKKHKRILKKKPNEKPWKTSFQDDKWIAKLSKIDPFLTSTQIGGRMAADNGVNVSVQTIRRRLIEFELYGRIA